VNVINDYSPFFYLLVDDPVHKERATLYHLLDEGLVYHLRNLMTLLLLPSDTFCLDQERPIFSLALHRILFPPAILRLPVGSKPEKNNLAFLQSAPFLLVLINSKIPEWVIELGNAKPIGLLTPSEEILDNAKKAGCFQTGLLKGFKDLVESYRVIHEIIKIRASDTATPPRERIYLEKLAAQEIFKSRPRLPFIHAIPLPQPHHGRAAAYLLNRLSNNVEEPSLLAGSTREDEEMILLIPQILDYSYAACSLLALYENGDYQNSDFSTTIPDLGKKYELFLSDLPNENKFEEWWKLGEKIISKTGPKLAIIVSTPSARNDLIKLGCDPLIY